MIEVAEYWLLDRIFSQGIVYAPDLQWAEMVISEMETFPKGKFDELTDLLTGPTLSAWCWNGSDCG